MTDFDKQRQIEGSGTELPWISVRTLIPLAHHLKARFTLPVAELIRHVPDSSGPTERRAEGGAADAARGSAAVAGIAETCAATVGTADGPTSPAHEGASRFSTKGRP